MCDCSKASNLDLTRIGPSALSSGCSLAVREAWNPGSLRNPSDCWLLISCRNSQRGTMRRVGAARHRGRLGCPGGGLPMHSLWSDADAERMVERYAQQGVGRDVALRVYT